MNRTALVLSAILLLPAASLQGPPQAAQPSGDSATPRVASVGRKAKLPGFKIEGAAQRRTRDGRTPAEETVCDGLRGAAFGLCNAYCEAKDCDEFPGHSCEVLRRNFQRITGEEFFPCDRFCGNDRVDEGEVCDGSDDAACPGGCNAQCGCPAPFPGDLEPPTVHVPPPSARTPHNLDPGQLPAGARAHLPAFDGDPLHVTFPAAEAAGVSASDVRTGIIDPILGALGAGSLTFADPPAAGVPMPVASFSGLAGDVAFEYMNNPDLLRPLTQNMIDVFTGATPVTPAVDAALEMGEGMNFSQFVQGIERLEIQYPFLQTVGSVPVEHTLLVASRWEGQTVTSVTGSVIANFAVANSPAGADPVSSGITGLAGVPGILGVTSTAPEDGPHLVLLPYGSDPAGVVQLRFAQRMVLRARSLVMDGPFIVWVDAQDGSVLKVEPLVADVSSTGRVYDRDPQFGATSEFFQVDASSGGQYTLKLAPALNRVDFRGDGFDAQDVSVPDSSGGSSGTFANFDQAPLNDASEALCASGTNKAFQQVNFFGKIHRYWQSGISLGVFTPFPPSAWSPVVEGNGCMGGLRAGKFCRVDADCTGGGTCQPGLYCNAQAGMTFGACAGYFDAACPDVSNGYLNFAHDNSVVAHELAHNLTWRLSVGRPTDWCGMPGCSIPIGWGALHDLADFWADHHENTNCTAGWVAKNRLGGVDNALNCAMHDEGGSLPRLHEVTVPFNPGAAGDHFPEHRAVATGGYADMQMGTAALWQVRLGMRSKCRPSGVPQFGVRFQRALRRTGLFAATVRTCVGGLDAGTLCTDNTDCSALTCREGDTGIYRLLYDLESQMVDEWVTSGSPGGPPAFRHNGPHTTSKVTAGFAREGSFLIPYQCLDGDASTADPLSCPSGENGGDAVIDIDDNTPGDDLTTAKGVLMPEVDFLKYGTGEFISDPPTFHVWTGPRYRLSGANGGRTFNSPAPCNTQFRVEVAIDPSFPAASTVMSPWIMVDTDPGTAASPECYGSWTPGSGEWEALQAGGPGSRIHYRARTRDAAGMNERLSTEPGAGLYTMVPPPYAVITGDGQSDY